MLRHYVSSRLVVGIGVSEQAQRTRVLGGKEQVFDESIHKDISSVVFATGNNRNLHSE